MGKTYRSWDSRSPKYGGRHHKGSKRGFRADKNNRGAQAPYDRRGKPHKEYTEDEYDF